MAVVINGTTGITSVNGSASAPSVTGTDTDTGIVYGTNTLSLVTGGTSRVTVDSSGSVGIGTSSPNINTNGTVLHINNSTASRAAITHYTNAESGAAANDGLIVGKWSDGTNYFYDYDSNPIVFGTNNGDRMRIDGSGNVGINVSPSSWGSAFRALQFNSGAIMSNSTGGAMYIMQNTYYNGTNWVASSTGVSSIYTQSAGAHQFFTQASVTGGTTATPETVLTIGTDGSMTFGKTTGGIVFNKSGALTNSLLNDYEVGSWTPVSLTTNVSVTAVQSASYVKIGRFVNAYCYMQVTNSTGGTGTWACGGLPFTASNNYGPAFKYYTGNVFSGSCYVESGSTYILDSNGLVAGAQGMMLCANYTTAS